MEPLALAATQPEVQPWTNLGKRAKQVEVVGMGNVVVGTVCWSGPFIHGREAFGVQAGPAWGSGDPNWLSSPAHQSCSFALAPEVHHGRGQDVLAFA